MWLMSWRLVVVIVGLAWGRDAELTCPEESGVYPDPEQCDKYWVSQSVYLCVLCLCSYVCVCVCCVCVRVFGHSLKNPLFLSLLRCGAMSISINDLFPHSVLT